MISGSHLALTAVEQDLCEFLVNAVCDQIEKNAQNLYEVSGKLLLEKVRTHDELRTVFGPVLQLYDSTLSYVEQLKMGKPAELDDFVKQLRSGSVLLTKEGRNVLTFLLLRNRMQLVTTSYHLVQYAKRRTVDARAIFCAQFKCFMEQLKFYKRN